MGPIGVAAHLAPFLPGHPIIKTGGTQAIHALAAAPWSSASILLISYAYIKCWAPKRTIDDALRHPQRELHQVAPRRSLPNFTRAKTHAFAHEMIFDLRPLKARSGIDETDVAKRLMTADPRAHGVVPGRRDADDRADGERIAGELTVM